jgi:hypothetical protein
MEGKMKTRNQRATPPKDNRRARWKEPHATRRESEGA